MKLTLKKYSMFLAAGVVLPWCLLLLSALPARAQAQPSADKTKILALENVWNMAIVHKDIRALDQLLADSFVGTDTDSSFMDKTQFIRSVSDKNYHPQQMVNETADVHTHENFAIVTGIYREKGIENGKGYDIRARFTDTWAFEDEEWRCVSSHASLFPEKKNH